MTPDTDRAAGEPAAELEPPLVELDGEPAEEDAAWEPIPPESEPNRYAEPVAAEPVAPVAAEPVRADERFASVDLLRGVALCGILAMNIVDFAWPEAKYMNPYAGPDRPSVLDLSAWTFNHVVFDTKMMTLFSMLFGAGLVLMGDRAEARGASIRGVYYRRVLWLLAIGLCHAYLIWAGDILVMYAECGLLLYLFRKKTPRTLLITGAILVAIIVPLYFGLLAGVNFMKATTARVEARRAADQTPATWETRVANFWTANLRDDMTPNAEKRAENFRKNMTTYRGGYLGIVKHRAKEVWKGQVFGMLFFGWWYTGGRMLIGMGLMKLGVFSAERSRRFYLTMLAVGYGIGLPLLILSAARSISIEFDPKYALSPWGLTGFLGSLPMVFGHIGAVMLIYQSGVATRLTRRLSAVGRMALSNYLTHSIVCTTLFYGYGFGLFGHVGRAALVLIVIAIWSAQIWYSPLWLARFRYGPAEWLWRSLTYGKPQPMRIRPTSAAPASA